MRLGAPGSSRAHQQQALPQSSQVLPCAQSLWQLVQSHDGAQHWLPQLSLQPRPAAHSHSHWEQPLDTHVGWQEPPVHGSPLSLVQFTPHVPPSGMQ